MSRAAMEHGDATPPSRSKSTQHEGAHSENGRYMRRIGADVLRTERSDKTSWKSRRSELLQGDVFTECLQTAMRVQTLVAEVCADQERAHTDFVNSLQDLRTELRSLRHDIQASKADAR